MTIRDGREEQHTKAWKGRVLLIWWLCIHISGIYLFTTGFFLTRYEVTQVSSCEEIPQFQTPNGRLRTNGHVKQESITAKSSAQGCWMPRRFNRTVLVIIDALRYDFVRFINKTRHEMPSSAQYYLNHVPVIHDALKTKPKHSLLYKFHADPPTMTMQRLKGLTTGSLPTFMDIKDNMGSAEIVEDSIIQQMWRRNKSMVFMGDDTWDSLYSKYFLRNYSYDSFNVKDLHTVDNGVKKNLFPELKKQDWDMIIAHFLGVDHVGHTFGPSDPHMEEKLGEMNVLLRDLMQELSEDTLLLVMGDHGMSFDGNHGGATDDETGAALFVYSKTEIIADVFNRGVFSSSKSFLSCSRDAGSCEVEWKPEKDTEIPQVDLVPTFSLLLGVPIPFGNLGAVIPDLFFYHTAQGLSLHEQVLENYKTLNRALEINANQVRHYFVTYSQMARLSASDLRYLHEKFESVHSLHHQERQLNASMDELVRFEDEITTGWQSFLREALKFGQSMWTQFDMTSIAWGISLLSGSTIMRLFMLFRSMNYDLYWVLVGSVVGSLACCTAWMLGVAVEYLPTSPKIQLLVISSMAGQLFAFVASLLGKSTLNVQTFRIPSMSCSMLLFPSSIGCVVLLHALSLLSNSYLVEEHALFLFFGTTVSMCVGLENLRLRNGPDARGVVPSIVLILCNRLLGALPTPNIINTNVSMTGTILPFVAVLILGLNYPSSSCTNDSTARSFVTSTLIIICYVDCAAYWLFYPLSSSTFLRLWLPRSVYVASLVGTLITLWPQRYGSTTSLDLQRRFMNILLFLSASFMLVLGPSSPGIVFLMHCQMISLCYLGRRIMSRVHFQSPEWTRCYVITFTLIWCVLFNFYYFATGHHTRFSSLQNAAAFVGFDTFSFYVAGVLVGYNTFGVFLIGVFSLPLLLLHLYEPIRALPDKKSMTSFTPSMAFYSMHLSFGAYYLFNALVTTIFVAAQRRHLFVWDIFAPKYIFDSSTLLIVDVFVLLGFMVSQHHFENRVFKQEQK